MNYFKKIIWNEGMFLTPHHFQQWDRYNEANIYDRLRFSTPYGWGVSEMSIDNDGLANGSFTLLNFSGVIQDGLIIRIPEQDLPPETRHVIDLFPPSLEHLDVYLGIPVYNPSVSNCRMDDTARSRPTRYTVEYTKVPDENTGENVREIAIARKNLKIFFSGDETGDNITIKIAELVRTPGGSITIRDTYVPPCMNISASPYLTRLIRGLLELISAKSSSLSGVRRGAGDIVTSDMKKLSLLQTINGYIPLLSHINNTGKTHPESLYMILSRLAGELSTFSTAYSPKDIPPYHHTDLFKTFSELDRKIRSILEGATPVQCITIPLEVNRENVLVGRVSDEKLLESAQFFFSVTGDIPEEQIRDLIPRRIKLGSLHELDMIVSTAMPGVRIYYTPRPPSSIPMKAGYQYFSLENHGEFWSSICRSKVLAFYVPADLKRLKYELLATKE